MKGYVGFKAYVVPLLTRQVENIKVTIIGQHRAVPLVSQAGNLPIGFGRALDQRNTPLGEDLNEDIPRQEGENGPVATVGERVRLFDLGLQTRSQCRELFVTRIHP